MQPRSIVIRFCLEGGEWQTYSPEKETITLGRSADCDLHLEHNEVSRYHARLSWEADRLWLTDLGSANGVFVEGQRISAHERTALQPGQRFEIGRFSLFVESPQADRTWPGKVTAVEHPALYVIRYGLGGDSPWQLYQLTEGEVTMGRAPDCDLVLADGQVSRHHARVRFEAGELWLIDLGATNGTQVEGQPLSPRKWFPLQAGQLFTVGPFTLAVEPSEPGEVFFADYQPETIIGEFELQPMATIRALDLKVLDRVTIGRAPDNNLVLDHPLVSRYHAEIERLGTRYHLRDLQSTNGVFVNNQRVQRDTWLNDRDTIQIGPHVFTLSGQNLQPQAETGLLLESHGLNQQVSKRLNLLQDIGLTIRPMEFVALVGMSGSGKTTLLNAISGYRPASDGEVLVNGVNLYQHYDLFRNDMGYVPQKDIVHAELTPESALGYVARLRMPPDTTAEERHTTVMEVLSDLDLTERKDVPISRLSGGQLKRVSIGVELLTKPRLFFLDEPTSGLDPGTEYEMMRLMRRLADQGRTVILVTHATKNVSLCDKVIFLARGGHLAYFGPPEKALEYFDAYRTPRERRQKEMEFDDIYRILSDEKRGKPAEWGERYLASADYQSFIAAPSGDGRQAARAAAPPAPAEKSGLLGGRQRVSAWRQFWILSARNLKILLQDKVSLALMLALAPAIGLMDSIWGANLFDPVKGDATKIITMWFMTALITVLVGALSSVREIVKEIDIYKRERAVNLKIFPYILSKIWVGLVLAFYQAGVLLLTRVIFVRPEMPSGSAYLALYFTLFLGTLCGYLIGLVISASAPNQNAAMLMIIAVLVPQFLFAGALLPLDLIPKGEVISLFMPTRWAFEAFVRVTGMGDQLVNDPCWSFPKNERGRLVDALKEDCPCMGVSIFTQCASFPGILSADFYDENVQRLLDQPQPVEPPQPTAFPYPTAFPSPTPLPTPTLLPSPTPYPTPADPREMGTYTEQRQEQGQEYQDSILSQFDEYRDLSKAQGEGYSEARTLQGDEYADLRQSQGDEYAAFMRQYGDERAEWQENREKAINSAEGLLETIYDNYGRAFRGTVAERWMAISAIMVVLIVLLLIFQKRKDVV